MITLKLTPVRYEELILILKHVSETSSEYMITKQIANSILKEITDDETKGQEAR